MWWRYILAVQQADALPSKLRRTLMNYAAPYAELRRTLMNSAAPCWDTPHPNELRCNLQSNDAPWWATPHLGELHRTLVSYTTPCWATTHPAELHRTLTELCRTLTELCRILLSRTELCCSYAALQLSNLLINIRLKTNEKQEVGCGVAQWRVRRSSVLRVRCSSVEGAA